MTLGDTGDTFDERERSSALEWLSNHGDALFAYAVGRVSDVHVAEELVQETFLAAVRSFDSFRGDSDVRTWLISILRYKILDHYRARAKRREMQCEQDTSMDAYFSKHGHLKNVSSWRGKPETETERAEFESVLDACIGKMGSNLATAFVLRTMDGLQTETVCQILNISATNLSVRLHRARLALRECLERHWFGRDAE